MALMRYQLSSESWPLIFPDLADAGSFKVPLDRSGTDLEGLTYVRPSCCGVRPTCGFGQAQNQSANERVIWMVALLRAVAGNQASSRPSPSGLVTDRHLTPRNSAW